VGITCTGPLIGVLQAKFIAIANTALSKVGNFSVLSYHSRNGITIAVAATLSLMEISILHRMLLPLPDNLQKLCLFGWHMTCGVDNSIAHLSTYFVRLPNDDQPTITTSTGIILQLNTFHGQDDWATGITNQPTLDAILQSNQAFGKPFTLLPSSISDPLSSTVIESTKPILRKIALLAAWPSICKAGVFK
jgi:hypothetical protein